MSGLIASEVQTLSKGETFQVSHQTRGLRKPSNGVCVYQIHLISRPNELSFLPPKSCPRDMDSSATLGSPECSANRARRRPVDESANADTVNLNMICVMLKLKI